jgi:hypothetical protein
MSYVILLIACALLGVAGWGAVIIAGLRKRNAGLWWRDYRRHLREQRTISTPESPIHVMFCFVDHYEPRWGKADYATEVQRVRRWVNDYPMLCEGRRDADGRPPQHSFFFPSEEYRPEHLDELVNLCRAGYGEIEVHLLHDNDTCSVTTRCRSILLPARRAGPSFTAIGLWIIRARTAVGAA